MFEIPAWLLAWFYGITHNYAIAIALIAVVVMAIITPLTLKSTKGMLEMQRLAPEMRKLQQQHRNDRQKLNEEMMKLYQEHKVNPMSSCLPLLAQMPVFIIMFRILHGLTYKPIGRGGADRPGASTSAAGQDPPAELGFVPRYISHTSDLYTSLFGQTEMKSFGLDLAKSPAQALSEGFATGLDLRPARRRPAGLYFLQQRMVAARAAVSPTMSPAQQKLMQYLPVAFAVFQVFFLTGLIIYYMAQAVLRIGQQAYITRRFYGHEEALGRQAQRAGDQARELAKQDGGGGGLFGQAQAPTRRQRPATPAAKAAGRRRRPTPHRRPSGTTKRTTRPEGPPDADRQGRRGAPEPEPPSGRPGGSRTKSGGKRRR